MALKEFDILRQQAKQKATANQQQQGDALKRAFSRTGGVGSGSFIKQQQIGIQKGQEQERQATQNIDFAEAQEKQRRDETAIERDFREKQFQAGQDQFGKQFGLQERQFEAGQDQFEKQFGLQKETSDRQLSLAERQQRAEETANAFNFLVSSTGAANEDTLLDFVTLSERLGRPATFDELQTLQRQRAEDISAGRSRPLR